MKGTKFYKWIIAILIVINLGTLAFMWFGKPPHPPHPGDEPRLASDIGLTGESKKKVDALEKQHHIDKQKLMETDTELHKQMFALIGSEKDVSEVQQKLNANKAEIEAMTYEFFDEVAAYCNEDQLKELKNHVEHRLMQMGPPPPPKK